MLFGIRGIEESSVYQDALRKGEARGRRGGEEDPDPSTVPRSSGHLTSRPRRRSRPWMISIACTISVDRVLDVATWDELLAASTK